MLNGNISTPVQKNNKDHKIPRARERHQATTMRSFYCAAWEEDGTRYYADPVTGEKKSIDPNSRMEVTFAQGNGSPQPPDLDAALSDQQRIALETKLASALPGLPVDLSESESLALIGRGRGAK